MEISIIIPLYNTEKYIEQCVLSVVRQDIDANRYEVLVINDGSTDRSPEIVADMAKIYSNIKLFSKANGGLSDTRNYGLERAEGDYVMFLDSDDYLAPNVFSQIIEYTRDTPDMLSFDFQCVDNDGKQIASYFESLKRPGQKMSCTGRDYILNYDYIPMVAAYCFRRQFLLQHSLRFMKIIHEDEEFTPRAIALSKTFKYLPITIYYYRQHSESITQAYNPRNLLYVINVAKSLKSFGLNEAKKDRQLRRFFVHRSSILIANALERSKREQMGMEREMLDYARELGVMPRFDKKHGNKFIYKCFPSIYLKHYKL